MRARAANVARQAGAIIALAALCLTAAAPRAALATTTVAPPNARWQVVQAAQISALTAPVARGLVDGVDRTIAPATTIADQIVPRGTVSVALAGAPIVNPYFAIIPVTISVDGEVVRKIYAGFRITSFMKTAVAARDIPLGKVIAAGDLTTGRVPSVGRSPIDPHVLVGRVLRVNVPHGSALTMEETSINEIVKAGQPAVLTVHDGPVALTADVIARTSGGLGEQVAVYNPDTRRELSGVVTGPGQVEVTLLGDQSQ